MKPYLQLSDFFPEVKSLEERLMMIAKRLRSVRKRRKLSQSALADRSFVSLGSIKRFEATGKISFSALYRLALALDVAEELDNLFAHVPPTYEEVIYG